MLGALSKSFFQNSEKLPVVGGGGEGGGSWGVRCHPHLFSKQFALPNLTTQLHNFKQTMRRQFLDNQRLLQYFSSIYLNQSYCLVYIKSFVLLYLLSLMLYIYVC